MTTETITAGGAALVAILGALTAMFLALRGGARKDAAAKDEKLEQIHVLVNSRLSKLLEEVAQLREDRAQKSGSVVDAAAAERARADAER